MIAKSGLLKGRIYDVLFHKNFVTFIVTVVAYGILNWFMYRSKVLCDFNNGPTFTKFREYVEYIEYDYFDNSFQAYTGLPLKH